jgi:hypothetical protein
LRRREASRRKGLTCSSSLRFTAPRRCRPPRRCDAPTQRGGRGSSGPTTGASPMSTATSTARGRSRGRISNCGVHAEGQVQAMCKGLVRRDPVTWWTLSDLRGTCPGDGGCAWPAYRRACKRRRTQRGLPGHRRHKRRYLKQPDSPAAAESRSSAAPCLTSLRARKTARTSSTARC